MKMENLAIDNKLLLELLELLCLEDIAMSEIKFQSNDKLLIRVKLFNINHVVSAV